MPLYVFRCEGVEHEGGAREWEGYLPTWDSPNALCACGAQGERVWRGRQYHAGLAGFPLTTRMLDGVERTYETRQDWELAVKSRGLRIRDDASWLDEEPGEPRYDWKTGKVSYPNMHTVLGGRGTWI